jgi:hypothetical protein
VLVTRGLMGPYLKDTYETYKKPSPRCGESDQKLSRDMGTSPICRPHDTQCGYMQGRILIRSGYRCTIVSQRVTSTWSSVNGMMNGGFHPSPRKCHKEQQKKRKSREKHSLWQSKFLRDEERAKAR